MWTRRLKSVSCVVLALVAGAAIAAGDFAIDFWTIDTGGETFCTGGNFELSGTIGQPDASTTALTGGGYKLTGGFWQSVGRGGKPEFQAEIQPDAREPADQDYMDADEQPFPAP